MPVFGNELRTEKFLLPGCNGEIFYKAYIQVDGEWQEFMLNVDCDRHLKARNISMDICISSGQPELIRDDHIKAYGAATMCTRNCAYKKAMAQKELDEHGHWLSDEIKAYLQKILESEDDE